MRILFDQGTPLPIAAALTGHSVTTARQLSWDTLSNGDLLRAAEEAGFDLLLTADKNLAHQQNLKERKIAIVVLGKNRWSLIQLALERIVASVDEATAGSYVLVEIPDR